MQAGRRSAPIIVLSADTTPKAILEASAAGVNVLLPKPVETKMLFAAIAQLTVQRSKRMAKVVQIFAPPQPA
jgi:DNA-binding NarL/FixJ family response regulator